MPNSDTRETTVPYWAAPRRRPTTGWKRYENIPVATVLPKSSTLCRSNALVAKRRLTAATGCHRPAFGLISCASAFTRLTSLRAEPLHLHHSGQALGFLCYVNDRRCSFGRP